MQENPVGLHFGPKDDVDKHDRMLSRGFSRIIQNIQSQGHDVFVSRGAKHYDFSEGTLDEYWRPRFTDGFSTERVLGQTAISNLGSVRDYGQLLVPSAQHPLALINDPALTRLDHSKYQAHREILFDRQAPTVMVDREATDFLDLIDGEKIVIKPDKGSGGRGVEIIGRGEIADALKRQPDVSLVAQEYVDMSAPLPSQIRGLDETEQAKLDSLKDRNKEVRLFVFRGNGTEETIPLARFFKQGDETNDTWAHLDPDTIPEEIVRSSLIVADRLAVKTAHGEVYAAVDHTFGSTDNEPENRWRIGEFNLWRPVFYRKGDPGPAKRFDQALADQLVRLARTTHSMTKTKA